MRDHFYQKTTSLTPFVGGVTTYILIHILDILAKAGRSCIPQYLPRHRSAGPCGTSYSKTGVFCTRVKSVQRLPNFQISCKSLPASYFAFSRYRWPKVLLLLWYLCPARRPRRDVNFHGFTRILGFLLHLMESEIQPKKV